MDNRQTKFYNLASNFCRWVEAGNHDLLQARKYLLEIMSYIPFLEEFRGAVETVEEFESRGFEGWKEDYKKLSDLPFQHYRQMVEPHDLEQMTPATGDLHDDFADIYGDLKPGLALYEKGRRREAVGLMVNSYFYHWGQHAASALAALDSFYRASQEGDYETDYEETAGLY